ncbi:hypothetical protein V8C44DRAFT_349507 [Trichoderma aethiopicum]
MPTTRKKVPPDSALDSMQSGPGPRLACLSRHDALQPIQIHQPAPSLLPPPFMRLLGAGLCCIQRLLQQGGNASRCFLFAAAACTYDTQMPAEDSVEQTASVSPRSSSLSNPFVFSWSVSRPIRFSQLAKRSKLKARAAHRFALLVGCSSTALDSTPRLAHWLPGQRTFKHASMLSVF